MPSGLKPVRRRLATGEVRLYWYHRASGKRVEADPTSAEGFIEIAALDRQAASLALETAFARGTYGDLWLKYRDSPEWRGLKPRTRSDYQAVRDWLGDAARGPVMKLAAKDVIGLRDKAAKAKGRRFGNYVLQVLRLTLAWGKVRGFVKENVAAGVPSIRRPKGLVKVNRAWRAGEVEAFALGAPFQILVPFALGLFAGMRQGDALKVTWSAYDGTTLRWTASKNGEPCEAPVTGLFKEILDKAKAERGLAVQIAVTAGKTPWSASGFRASFFKRLRTLRTAGAVEPGCTFHGLRHTVVTLARNDGVSDFRAASAIGDRSTKMAETYGRDADRISAQGDVLASIQKHFANVEWKTVADPIGKRVSKPKRGKAEKTL